MSAGTEGEAGIKHQVDRVGIGNLLPAWADPQALAKLHGVEVSHPLAFPVFVFNDLNVGPDSCRGWFRPGGR